MSSWSFFNELADLRRRVVSRDLFGRVFGASTCSGVNLTASARRCASARRAQGIFPCYDEQTAMDKAHGRLAPGDVRPATLSACTPSRCSAQGCKCARQSGLCASLPSGDSAG